MDSPYIATIMPVGFNFAPIGWMFCNGALLSIAEYTALYSLIGTTYGGDGMTTFALPDLRGRVCINDGQGPGLAMYTIGQASGSENVTLISNQLAAHSHPTMIISTAANGVTNTPSSVNGPAKSVDSSGNPFNLYAAPDGVTLMQGGPAQIVGGNQPHSNLQPYLAINYIIAVEGIFPSRA
jgi:microcystin-dependent protein